MRIEILLFLVSFFLLANVHTEGKFLKKLLLYKKYYQMMGIILAALFIYYLIKRNPMKAKEIMIASNEYIKYLPIDKNTTDIISPILDFTSRSNFYGDIKTHQSNPILPLQSTVNPLKNTKRSVSETKKKFVAARQNWKCGECNQQLKASFEVDHIIRLERGGSNNIDNLVALCRECHGDKTTVENL